MTGSQLMMHSRHLLLVVLLAFFAAGCSDSSSPDRVFDAPVTTPDASGDDSGGEAEPPAEDPPAEDPPAEDPPAEDPPAEDPPTEEPAASIVVTPSLGLISGAEVSVTQADGTVIEGATGTLNAEGVVTINHDGSYDGPILVTITGTDSATYFDEAAGTNLPMGSDVTLRAFAPSAVAEVGVTILTELAAQLIDDIEGAATAADVNAVNDAIRMTLAPDLPDILTPPTLVSETNLTAQALGTADADTYALRLAALANMAADDEAPAVSILQQLAADLADGDIDGEGASGPIADLDYTADTFESLFANAMSLAASTLADADLMAAVGSFSITLDANVIESVIAAGVGLPASVSDLINGGSDDDADSGGGDDSSDDSGDTPVVDVPDVDISGDYDLTISGEIITFGIGTAFDVVIQNILAPSPSDTSEITQVIEDTIEGVSGITNLQITIINNTTDRITFEVSFEATQGGVTVTMNLLYDYVPSGGSSGGDSSGDGSSGDNSSGDDSGSEGDIAALGQICFFGGEPEAVSIPQFLTANTWDLTFSEVQAGAPYADGEVRTFLFSSSGGLFIDNVQVASTPVICNGNEREAIWKDTTNNLIYSVSDLTGSFNEVNVGRGDDGGFLGQFLEN